jgi:hypothetical protein
MTTNTNLAGLRAQVKAWSQRRNIPDATIDDFIEIALSRACRLLRIPPLEGFSSVVPSDTGFIELPNDFQEVKTLTTTWMNTTVVLDRKSISEVDYTQGQLSDTAAGSGPCIFSRFGNYLRIAPWVSTNTGAVDLYYYKVDFPLTDDTSTNWFTLYAPEVILYGALVELSDYTRDTVGAAQWTNKFNQEINTIQGVEDRAEWRGSTVGISLHGSTGGQR